MKYKLPIGSIISRYHHKEEMWHAFATTKEVIYFGTELNLYSPSIGPDSEIYITMIPLTDGYNSLRIWKSDLVVC